MSRVGVPYTPCKLFYDGFESLAVGDYLKTPAGSAYLIQAVRINRNRAYRQHLECVRWPAAEIPRRARVYPLHWYRRDRKRGRTLASLRSVIPRRDDGS
ncbi:MAG: hypothetical protein AUI15_05905 [Actinobacteria bacterium 13_2_20CM_2_66_6]|nr:MAG: hypothetical protein AUI15_05905 [Actinobacteria bacterium 13_2_20CM_2_66_6]